MNYQNIEIKNKREQSNYPFTGLSTLKVGKYTFPVNWVRSLSLQISSAVFPLYINTIYTDTQYVILSVIDKMSQVQCYIKLGPESAAVVTAYNTICGQISVDNQLYNWLYDLIKDSVYGRIDLNSNDLVFDGSVITCVCFKGYTGLSVNNRYAGSDVILNFQRNIETVIQGSQVRLNVYGDYDYSFQKQQKLQYINGIDLKNKSLLIQHRALSDLRVVTDSNKISLIGVTDVT